jgi:hypothetical protein
MNLIGEDSNPSFWRAIMWVDGFPFVMFTLAIVPGLNFTYSGHAGISWFVLPPCFPWVTLRAVIAIMSGSEVSRIRYKSFFKVTIPSCMALALPLFWAATTSIRMTFGLPVSTWSFFAIMVSPFPWWYFT